MPLILAMLDQEEFLIVLIYDGALDGA